MNEIVFPVIGAMVVLFVVLPLSALFAKALLCVLERTRWVGPLDGLGIRYVVLVGSSLLPLAWFLSAALHQAESGREALACLLDHEAAALCFEPGFFAVLLAVGAAGSAARELRADRAVGLARSPQAAELSVRLERIVETHASLSILRGRLGVADLSGFALGTRGWFEPKVLVGLGFARGVDDVTLASALGHEAEHVRSLDPLRYALLRLALAANPVGRRALDAHAARWCSAREAQCDRHAVLRGSAPLPLAQALLRAARPGEREVVALGARDTVVLKLRVGMLLAFAEHPPERCCRREASPFGAAVVLFTLALLLPHQTGTVALDLLHTGTERAVSALLR